MPRAGATSAPSAGGPRHERPQRPTRPRPQYGEYATPEEQRARIKQPDTTWALEPAAGALRDAAAPAAVDGARTTQRDAGRAAGHARAGDASRRSRCSPTGS